jgi:hypothetical protein
MSRSGITFELPTIRPERYQDVRNALAPGALHVRRVVQPHTLLLVNELNTDLGAVAQNPTELDIQGS